MGWGVPRLADHTEKDGVVRGVIIPGLFRFFQDSTESDFGPATSTQPVFLLCQLWPSAVLQTARPRPSSDVLVRRARRLGLLTEAYKVAETADDNANTTLPVDTCLH